MASTPTDQPGRFKLQVLSPSLHVPQPLLIEDLSVTSTVGQVKALLRERLPIKPADDAQRLIHRGRLLVNDSETMLDVFGVELLRCSDRQIIHLVLRDPEPLFSPPPSSSQQPASRAQTPAIGQSPLPQIPGQHQVQSGAAAPPRVNAATSGFRWPPVQNGTAQPAPVPSIFQQPAAQPVSAQSAPVPSIFQQPAAQSGPTQGATAPSTSQHPQFGTPQGTTGPATSQAPLFGLPQGATASSTSRPPLFGAPQGATASSTSRPPLFGAPQGATASSTSQPPLFGAPQGATASSTSLAPLFGAPQGATASSTSRPPLFGAPQGATASSTSLAPLFGAPQGATASSTSRPPLFGAPQGAAASSTSRPPLFGAPQGATASSTSRPPLFGAPQGATASSTSQPPLFGAPQGATASSTFQQPSRPFGAPQGATAPATSHAPLFGAPQGATAPSIFQQAAVQQPGAQQPATQSGHVQSAIGLPVSRQQSQVGTQMVTRAGAANSSQTANATGNHGATQNPGGRVFRTSDNAALGFPSDGGVVHHAIDADGRRWRTTIRTTVTPAQPSSSAQNPTASQPQPVLSGGNRGGGGATPNSNPSQVAMDSAGNQGNDPATAHPQVYVVSAPGGPRAILVNGDSVIFYSQNISAPRAAGTQRNRPGVPPQIMSRTPLAAGNAPNPRSNNLPAEQQPQLQPQNDMFVPPQMQAQLGHAIDDRQIQAVRFAQIWPHIWMMMRLAGFIWWFTSPASSWLRWITVISIAIAMFLVNTGLMHPLADRVWALLRHHLENMIPHAAGVEARQQQHPAADGVPNDAANALDPVTPGHPTPGETAARLVQQRRQTNADWLLNVARRLERAGILFIASLAPGLAERYIAQAEALERQRRQEADAAAAAAAAAQAASEVADEDTRAADGENHELPSDGVDRVDEA